MQNKIKLSLIFLVLIALFSVFTFFSSLGNKIPPSLTGNLGDSLLPQVEEDADHDGLTNREESYWNTDFQNPDTDGDGFLDGEEVSSGHNPLKPGPDDKLSPLNLTDKIKTLVVGGLYSEDLKPDNQQFESSINNLSAVIVDDFYQSLPLQNPQIILINNSKESQEFYLKNTVQIIKQLLLTPSNDIGPRTTGDQYIVLLSGLKNNFKDAYQNLVQMSVPESWQEIHYDLLDIINRSMMDYESLGSYQSDPYRAYIALEDIKNMDGNVKNLLKLVNSNINQNHLILDDNFFKLLNQLYK